MSYKFTGLNKLGIIFLVFIFASSYCFAEDLKSATVIEARTGKDFTIILSANPTTGYQWQLAKPLNKNKIQFVNSEYFPDKTGLVGAGGKQVWRFKARTAGRANITFKYVRQWEKNIPPESIKKFIIFIK
jgi:Predicted secreted protein